MGLFNDIRGELLARKVNKIFFGHPNIHKALRKEADAYFKASIKARDALKKGK